MGRTYPNEIKRILFYPGGDVGREARACALEIATEAGRNAQNQYGRHPGDRRRTGNLARSYRVEVIPGTNTFVVRNKLKYAAAMERGAKAHDIKARRVSFLEFRDRNGVWRKVKLVKHPGSAPRRTLETATRTVVRRRYGVG
jgi:hypothetical protein